MSPYKTQEEFDASTHFHDVIKGCRMKQYKLVRPGYGENPQNHEIEVYFCKTHGIMVCRCGWEYGFHRDEFSHPLRNQPPLSNYIKHVSFQLKEKLLATIEHFKEQSKYYVTESSIPAM